MISPFSAGQSAILSIGLIAANVTLVRLFLPAIAGAPRFRKAITGLCALETAIHATWRFAPYWPAKYFALRCAMTLLFSFPWLLASIPLAALFRRAMRAILSRAMRVVDAFATRARRVVDAFPTRATRAKPKKNATTPRSEPSVLASACAEPHPPTLTRRALLGAATALAPGVALGTGLSGFYAGQAAPRDKHVVFTYPDLASDLVGLRILHLSDLHLGADRTVEDLEAALERLRGDVPDLIVLTGDVAENVDLLAPALRAVVRLNPRLGVYSSLGNHEYINDIDAALATYRAQRDVRLLRSEGETLRVGSARIHLGGADDPRMMHGDLGPFLADSVTRAFARAPDDTFKLLLSHRPEGLDAGAARGVDLVLSGHTHGGQIGFNGKSAFERIWPERYLWGPYARGRTRLYTTSGFGHWFPYRVNCAAEIPTIELSRS